MPALNNWLGAGIFLDSKLIKTDALPRKSTLKRP